MDLKLAALLRMLDVEVPNYLTRPRDNREGEVAQDGRLGSSVDAEGLQSGGDASSASPRPAAVTFATTEHFTLQGARAATISESTGRATMFLGAVSGSLVALGLIATASRVGTAFYAFGLVLLPTLSFIGFVTYERALQCGIEDRGYARRIALLRGFYFDEAPELTPYLLSVPVAARLEVQGLWSGRWQGYRTVAGMVAVITAVLVGSAVGLLAGVVSGHSLATALAAGGLVGSAALAALMRSQESAWKQAAALPIVANPSGEAPAAELAGPPPTEAL